MEKGVRVTTKAIRRKKKDLERLERALLHHVLDVRSSAPSNSGRQRASDAERAS